MVVNVSFITRSASLMQVWGTTDRQQPERKIRVSPHGGLFRGNDRTLGFRDINFNFYYLPTPP